MILHKQVYSTIYSSIYRAIYHAIYRDRGSRQVNRLGPYAGIQVCILKETSGPFFASADLVRLWMIPLSTLYASIG